MELSLALLLGLLGGGGVRCAFGWRIRLSTFSPATPVMATFIDTIKAILTRLIFAAHGLVAVYRVVTVKNDPWYWYLTITILLLVFEGIFTLTIKKTQEWKWFCPSVFLYLASVCPSIWLIELDKLETRLMKRVSMEEAAGNMDPATSINQSASENANQTKVDLSVLKDVGIPLDLENIPIPVDTDTLVVIIEQFLMLILIIGRWMLPKGDLTRDQLSQLLLVYIGTAADIIEFFDSFKDEKVNTNKALCIMVLSIWSWSLLQFTLVLTATKGRKTRITEDKPSKLERAKEICCSIDVWGILINIILQDAPFFVFRLLLITYYKLISYMNIFFTCKNTLVITLQFYRLLVVQLEKKEELKKEELKKKKLLASMKARKQTEERRKTAAVSRRAGGESRQRRKHKSDLYGPPNSNPGARPHAKKEEKSRRKAMMLRHHTTSTTEDGGSVHNYSSNNSQSDHKSKRSHDARRLPASGSEAPQRKRGRGLQRHHNFDHTQIRCDADDNIIQLHPNPLGSDDDNTLANTRLPSLEKDSDRGAAGPGGAEEEDEDEGDDSEPLLEQETSMIELRSVPSRRDLERELAAQRQKEQRRKG